MLIQINVCDNNKICLASLTDWCVLPVHTCIRKHRKEYYSLWEEGTLKASNSPAFATETERFFEWLASHKWKKVLLCNHTKHWRQDKPIYIWELRAQANPIRKDMRQDKKKISKNQNFFFHTEITANFYFSHLSLRVNLVYKQLCNDGLQKYTRTLFINVFLILKMHTNYTLSRCYTFHSLYSL